MPLPRLAPALPPSPDGVDPRRGGFDALLYQMIPDLDILDEQLANEDPDWVSLTVRGIGEMVSDTASPAPNDVGSWMDLSPHEVDEHGVLRAYVHVQLRAGDLMT
jgi:hypothetical protein